MPPETPSPHPGSPPAKATGGRAGRRLGYVLGGVALVGLTLWANTGSPTTITASPSFSGAPTDVYDPVLAGEALPDGYRQLLPRDAIRPVYDPVFVSADDISWDADVQIIGVEIDGQSRAYPVSFLNSREMVIDEIADVPIVVTW